ncbi:prepilin peptidase [Candidatus Bathyarchaeota archaeon]|nr:prepilin peptidase [Candidatus Bathyarchaeota archaeon]
MFEFIRVSLTLAMLVYASLRDLREREVPDMTWIIFGLTGLIIDLYEVYNGRLALLGLGFTLLASTAITFLIGYLGLFGGADFKALVVLSLLQPYPPRVFKPHLGMVSGIYPLTVLSNSALLGASSALFQAFRNLYAAYRGSRLFEGLGHESSWRKLMVLISGSKMNLNSIRGPPFHYPLETMEEGVRRLLSPFRMDDDEALKVFEEFRRAGASEIWISNTLPFIVFIMLGYLTSIFLGDIALSLLFNAMSLIQA